jgi:hypothetical protein
MDFNVPLLVMDIFLIAGILSVLKETTNTLSDPRDISSLRYMRLLK